MSCLCRPVLATNEEKMTTLRPSTRINDKSHTIFWSCLNLNSNVTNFLVSHSEIPYFCCVIVCNCHLWAAQWNTQFGFTRLRRNKMRSHHLSHSCGHVLPLRSTIGGNARSDVISVTGSAVGRINTRSDSSAISYQGRKSLGVLASTVFERNFFFRPSLPSTWLHSGHDNLFHLSTTEPSRRKALFLYRFVKKKQKKRQPKWSLKCARTTTATARLLSTGWSTWSCLPLTPTLLWWEKRPVKSCSNGTHWWGFCCLVFNSSYILMYVNYVLLTLLCEAW